MTITPYRDPGRDGGSLPPFERVRIESKGRLAPPLVGRRKLWVEREPSMTRTSLAAIHGKGASNPSAVP